VFTNRSRHSEVVVIGHSLSKSAAFQGPAKDRLSPLGAILVVGAANLAIWIGIVAAIWNFG